MRSSGSARVLACCAAMAVGLLAGSALAQPANDNCGTDRASFTIPPVGGSVSGDLTGASRDASSTSCPGLQTGVDTYWYWTPSFSGQARIETCNGADFDTVLSLHTDSCPVDASTQVAGGCNDDACGLQSRITVTVAAGTTYILRVATYSTTTIPGPYTVTISPLVALTNDNCGPTNPLLTVGVPVNGANDTATTSFTISPGTLCGPAGDAAGGNNDVFYRFIPPATGPYTFSLCGSTFDTVLSVHSSCPADSNNVLACNDDSTATVPCVGQFNTQSFIPGLSLTAGQTYTVRVAGYGAAVGSFTLTVTTGGPALGACCSPRGVCTSTLEAACTGTWTADTACSPNPCPQPQRPVNDECTAAIALTLGTTTPGTLVFASQTIDPAILCTGSDADVFFSFTAPVAGDYQVATTADNAGFVSLVVADDCSFTNVLSCDFTDEFNTSDLLTLNAGQTILIRVADFEDDSTFSILVATAVSGTCCTPRGDCSITTQADCADSWSTGGTCTPNTCPAPPRPINDECTPTNTLVALNSPYTGTNVNASTTISIDLTACGTTGAEDGADIYVRFIPATSGTFTFDLCGSEVGFDTTISLFDSCPSAGASPIACNDDSADTTPCPGSGLTSFLPDISLSAGITYYVRIAGYQGAAIPDEGQFVLLISDGGVPTTGACCAAVGTCSITDASNCAGVFQGVGTACSPNPCTATAGACCAASGGCTVTESGACTGTFQGVGTSCAPNPCPQPGQGACCFFDGTCFVLPQASCSGDFRGVGTSCPPSPACAQPTGACCLSGACSTQTLAACSTSGGVFQGIGTFCTPNPCPQPSGICCRGSTCATSTSAACTGPYTRFVASAACNAAGVNTAPCCRADFNQDRVVGVQDIFDYLTDWFSGSPRADFTNNGAGAPGVQSIFDYLTAWFTGGCAG